MGNGQCISDRNVMYQVHVRIVELARHSPFQKMIRTFRVGRVLLNEQDKTEKSNQNVIRHLVICGRLWFNATLDSIWFESTSTIPAIGKSNSHTLPHTSQWSEAISSANYDTIRIRLAHPIDAVQCGKGIDIVLPHRPTPTTSIRLCAINRANQWDSWPDGRNGADIDQTMKNEKEKEEQEYSNWVRVELKPTGTINITSVNAINIGQRGWPGHQTFDRILISLRHAHEQHSIQTTSLMSLLIHSMIALLPFLYSSIYFVISLSFSPSLILLTIVLLLCWSCRSFRHESFIE